MSNNIIGNNNNNHYYSAVLFGHLISKKLKIVNERHNK